MPVVHVTLKTPEGKDGASLTYPDATAVCEPATRILTVTLAGHSIETHVEFQPEQYTAWRQEETTPPRTTPTPQAPAVPPRPMPQASTPGEGISHAPASDPHRSPGV